MITEAQANGLVCISYSIFANKLAYLLGLSYLSLYFLPRSCWKSRSNHFYNMTGKKRTETRTFN